MNKYVPPTSYTAEDIAEAENFLNRLTADRFATQKWSLLWKNLGEVVTGLNELGRKWKRYRESMRLVTVKGVIKRDLDSLMHKFDVDILETEDAIEWGIRSSQSMIDELPSRLPYLIQANFYVYIQEIGDLLDAVIDRTSHNEVIELLKELRNHPDIITIGQFSTNEMVEYYRHLRDSEFPDTRYEIIKYIETYQKLCGIYAKDMILCYCLLLLKETGGRPTYQEAQPVSRNGLDRINHVKRRIPSFGKIYDRKLRNASSHTDIDVDRDRHLVTIYLGREKKSKYYTYQQIVSITQDLSALIVAFRLLMIILANRDWRATRDLLR
jgi:hypothetical protein